MAKRLISSILIITLAMCSFVTAFAADVNLSDIDASHWAWEVVSELVAKGTINGYPDGTFRPGNTVSYAEFEKMITGIWKADNPNLTPINREAALDMLWQYSASPVNYTAPGIITSQMVNKDAAAWGYSTGIMQGSDGLNLNPSGTLTRAEAAALIVRSTKPVSGDHTFASSVSDEILEYVYDVYDLFEGEYKADEQITPDALWNAAKKYGKIQNSDIQVNSATIGDAVTLLSYAACLQFNGTVYVKNGVDKASDKYGSSAQLYEAFVLENGLEVPGNKSNIATKKDIALILVQLDDLIGKRNYKINKSVSLFPQNYKDYAYLTKDVPVEAYAVPFGLNDIPANSFGFAINYSQIFENFVNEMAGTYTNNAVEFTFYPTLVCEDSSDCIVRAKCKVINGTGYDVFGEGFENAGSEFYVDLHTGNPVSSMHIPVSEAKIGKFICNQ